MTNMNTLGNEYLFKWSETLYQYWLKLKSKQRDIKYNSNGKAPTEKKHLICVQSEHQMVLIIHWQGATQICNKMFKCIFLRTSGFGYQQYLAIMKTLMYSDSVLLYMFYVLNVYYLFYKCIRTISKSYSRGFLCHDFSLTCTNAILRR